MCAGTCHDDDTTIIPINVTMLVNGNLISRMVDPRRSLLDFLREDLNLKGTKKGCDHGQCGACTIHVNGERRLACLQFAAQLQSTSVTTIEGIISVDGKLHPLQDAFIRHDALQCGYCTPGQIMSALALIKSGCPKNIDEIKEAMSGNICRCGAYNGIIAAIREVAHGTD